jgi:Zn-dependent alcohol dehydrogenase
LRQLVAGVRRFEAINEAARAAASGEVIKPVLLFGAGG